MRASILILVVSCACLTLSPILQAATFTVTHTADTHDALPGDGLCADGTGLCSLRAAIDEANANPLSDDIVFDIQEAPGPDGTYVFTPFVPYVLNNPTTSIDGLSQSGTVANSNPPGLTWSPDATLMIEIDGSLIPRGQGHDAIIQVQTNFCVLQGLIIHSGPFHDLRIGEAGVNHGANSIANCVIGLADARPSRVLFIPTAPKDDLAPVHAALAITENSSNTVQNCVLSGHHHQAGSAQGAGLLLQSPEGTTPGGIIVEGCLMGIGAFLNENAPVPAPNIFGLVVQAPYFSCEFLSNIIAGNASHGVWLFSPEGSLDINGGHKIKSSHIGLVPTDGLGGALAFGNGGDGLRLDRGSMGTQAGGLLAEEGNVIAGNSGHGVYVLASEDLESQGNSLRNNLIGTDPSGSIAMPNGGHGFTCRDAGTGNTAEANLLAFNQGNGARMEGCPSSFYNNRFVANGGWGLEIRPHLGDPAYDIPGDDTLEAPWVGGLGQENRFEDNLLGGVLAVDIREANQDTLLADNVFDPDDSGPWFEQRWYAAVELVDESGDVLSPASADIQIEDPEGMLRMIATGDDGLWGEGAAFSVTDVRSWMEITEYRILPDGSRLDLGSRQLLASTPGWAGQAEFVFDAIASETESGFGRPNGVDFGGLSRYQIAEILMLPDTDGDGLIDSDDCAPEDPTYGDAPCDADEDGFCNADIIGQVQGAFCPNDCSEGLCAPGDCGDNSADVHPGAEELCNGIDDNCNASIDEGFVNTDGDDLADCVDPDDDDDGSEDGDDCQPLNSAVHPGAEENCKDGIDNDCDGAIDAEQTSCLHCGNGLLEVLESCDDGNRDPGDGCSSVCRVERGWACRAVTGAPHLCGSAPGPGGLIITEIMKDPSCLADSAGEWFELHNPGEVSLQLAGWTLGDADDAEAVLIENLLIGPGDFAVLCSDSEQAATEGIPCDLDYSYGALSMGNGDDSLMAFDPAGRLIDEVVYTENEFPDSPGASLSLDAGLDASDNDLAENWCAGKRPLESTCMPSDMGTPGQANPSCIECGDGILGGDEACDDGDLNDGDGCDVACEVETGFACTQPEGGGPSLCGHTAVAGEVVITEVLYDPFCVADTAGEWFEIINASDRPLELGGWSVSDAGNDADSLPELSLAVGATLVICRNPDPALNGGVHCDASLPFSLTNGADEILIHDGTGMLIDGLVYDTDGAFPSHAGASMQLSAGLDHEANDSGFNWCISLTTVPEGCGDLGSPGLANAICGSSCWDIDEDGHEDMACGGTDCNDRDASIHPRASERLCNDADDDCNPATPDDPDPTDEDGDEFSLGCGQDCDDTDAFAHPGAVEICDDGRDQDCNGMDLACDCPDADDDGFFNTVCGGTDCDDADDEINPGLAEDCENHIDDDCDSLTDGDDPTCRFCDDADGDGYGEGDDCLGPDCNDLNASIHPGARENCGNAIDDDCDELVDEADPGCRDCEDSDGDGYGRGSECIAPDCDDDDAQVNPGAEEHCANGADDDCDGAIDANDSDCAVPCVDADFDGFADEACGGTDCDDGNNEVYPGAEELCENGLDDDCDGATDIQDSDCTGRGPACDCQSGSTGPIWLGLLLALLFALRRRQRGIRGHKHLSLLVFLKEA